MVSPSQSGGAVTFPALDSLRAIAAIAVVATHAAFWAGAYTSSLWGTPLARLDVGVAVFFVLSGFLLSRGWIARHATGQPAPPTGRYLWKRLLRLGPVYVLTAVVALLVLPGNRGAGFGDWATTLLMGNIYVDDRMPAGLTQMWSLATEAAFYLVLPVIMWLALPRRRGAAQRSRVIPVLILMAAVTVAWLMDLSVRWDTGHTMIRLWLPSYLTWFAVGIAMAMYDVRRRSGASAGDRASAFVAEIGRSTGLCWLAAGALFVIAATPIAGPADLTPPTLGSALTKNLLYAVIAGLVILPGVFAQPGDRFIKVLSHRAFRHVGHLSYGLFCVHLILLELLAEWRGIELFEGRGWELFLLTMVCSLVVCEVLYRVVEVPSMRLRDIRPPWSSSTKTTAPSARATNS